LVVSQHDGVCVSADDPDRVFQRLAFRHGRELARVVCAHGLAAQPEHRGLEGQAGSCRWLVEKSRHHSTHKAARKQVRLLLHRVCPVEELLEQWPRELLAFEHMPQATSDGHQKSSFPISRGSDLKELGASRRRAKFISYLW